MVKTIPKWVVFTIVFPRSMGVLGYIINQFIYGNLDCKKYPTPSPRGTLRSHGTVRYASVFTVLASRSMLAVLRKIRFPGKEVS